MTPFFFGIHCARLLLPCGTCVHFFSLLHSSILFETHTHRHAIPDNSTTSCTAKAQHVQHRKNGQYIQPQHSFIFLDSWVLHPCSVIDNGANHRKLRVRGDQDRKSMDTISRTTQVPSAHEATDNRHCHRRVVGLSSFLSSLSSLSFHS